MHRSKLVAALCDVPAEVFEAETAFWEGAMGRSADREDPDYADLGAVTPGMTMMVQRIEGPARVHLDIETDDVEAEVARLERLGASVVERIQTWVVMRDPGGLLFCVVRVQVPDTFEVDAALWEDPA